MFASFSFSLPSKATVKSAAIKTAKYAAYFAGAAGAVYGGVVLAKRYGGAVSDAVATTVDTANEQVVGG